MNILISAYACEPDRGSEPGIGWKWATYLSKDKSKEVFVITRQNNQAVINKYWERHTQPANLHFFYYDLSPSFIWLKHHGLPVNIYYALWLYESGKLAGKLHQKYGFDIAHHLTFGVFRDASFLYKLNIPFVIGPIGGGEYTPSQLMPLYSVSERFKEYIRLFANKLALYNPFLVKSFNRATLILTKTNDTKKIFEKKDWALKTFVKLEIGTEQISLPILENPKNVFLYVGRFITWKGIKLILEAFYLYREKKKDGQLLLIGEGPLQSQIEEFREQRNLEEYIKIIPWITRQGLKQYYQSSQALLFPSLHDSSGNVVLEALASGLPTITLDCGGPACVLGETLKAMIVSTHKTSISDIVENMAAKMRQISSDTVFYKHIQKLSLERAQDFLWDKAIESTYSFIENKVTKIS